jgi:hypothetical protein
MGKPSICIHKWDWTTSAIPVPVGQKKLWLFNIRWNSGAGATTERISRDVQRLAHVPLQIKHFNTVPR